MTLAGGGRGQGTAPVSLLVSVWSGLAKGLRLSFASVIGRAVEARGGGA